MDKTQELLIEELKSPGPAQRTQPTCHSYAADLDDDETEE